MATIEKPIPEETVQEWSDTYVESCQQDSLYPMSAGKERILFARARNGNQEASAELHETYRGLVAYMVREFHGANGNTPEMMRSGMEMLEESLQEFNLGWEVRFSDVLCERLGELGSRDLDQLEVPSNVPMGSSEDETVFRREPFAVDKLEWMESNPGCRPPVELPQWR